MKINRGAVIKGGTSLAYHTGTWRDQKPVIDSKTCKQCGICKEVCPDDSVRYKSDQYEIDYMYCKGCGICAFECPVDAINMVPEEK
jgi:pyruvate ferredoxin oxidoreductase delta subunit